MSNVSFDDLTRRGALLDVAADRKNARKRTAKKARQKCKRQVGECKAFFESQCEGDAECLATAELCCPDFGSCDPGGFLSCFLPQI